MIANSEIKERTVITNSDVVAAATKPTMVRGRVISISLLALALALPACVDSTSTRAATVASTDAPSPNEAGAAVDPSPSAHLLALMKRATTRSTRATSQPWTRSTT